MKTNISHALPVLPLVVSGFLRNFKPGNYRYAMAIVDRVTHVASNMFIPEVGAIDDMTISVQSAAKLTNLDGRKMRDAVDLLKKQKGYGVAAAKFEFSAGHLAIASAILAIHPKSDSATEELDALLSIAVAADMPLHGLENILANGKLMAREIGIPASFKLVWPPLAELQSYTNQAQLAHGNAAKNGHDHGESGDDAAIRRRAEDAHTEELGDRVMNFA